MNVNDIIISSRPAGRTASLRRRAGRPFLILYLYAVLVYLPMLVLRLTNDMDGLWGQDDYVSGVWELSIGRWFWPYLDKIRFRISLDPLPGMLSLALYTAGYLLIASLLGDLREPAGGPDSQKPGRGTLSLPGYAGGFLFLASTGISCQMSYSYMVITFAVSFLLAVFAVCAAARASGEPFRRNFPKTAGWIAAGALAVALMMGCYQASIGVTAAVALFVFLRMLYDGAGRKETGRKAGAAPEGGALPFALRMFLSILLGGVLYEILLHLNFALFHTEPASYGGFSDITPASVLQNLPGSIRHTYSAFAAYFRGAPFRFNILQQHRAFCLVYLVPAGVMLILWIRTARRSIGRGILFLLGMLLIPIFASCYLLPAYGTTLQMQTTVGLSLVIPMVLCAAGWGMPEKAVKSRHMHAAAGEDAGEERTADHLADSGADSAGLRVTRGAWGRKRVRKAGTILYAAAVFLLIYGAAGQVEVDSYAMYAGRRATETLGRSILSQLQATGQDYVNGQVQIFGCPQRAATFARTALCDRANDYAQYGDWPEDNSIARICWGKLFSNELRVNVSYVFNDTAADIAATPEAAAMPVWPAQGSVQNIYGVSVVKLCQPGQED